MNYLAHIYLSGTNEKLMVGNFIADSIKGNDWRLYALEIQKGIKIHREIDYFTDTHEIVKRSKKKLWKKYRHFSAVIIDIFYDHFLAKNWENYSQCKLEVFTKNTYHILENNSEIFSEKISLLLESMIKNNWLYNYQFIECIRKVMFGMSKKTSFNIGVENSTEELIKYYDEFFYEFKLFFPLLIQFVDSKMIKK